jgi:molecular chaperone GrpE
MTTSDPQEVFDLIDDDSTGIDLQAFADGIDVSDTQKDIDSDQVLKALGAKIAELEELRREDDNKYNRLLADYQNLHNRTAREIKSGVEQAERQILLEILQVLDSFNRCSGSTYQSIQDFRAGVDIIGKQFLTTLRRLKVSEVEINVGEALDPHIAEALTAVDTPDHPQGSIVDVCEKGYKIGDQLLRPAKVVVAR